MQLRQICQDCSRTREGSPRLMPMMAMMVKKRMTRKGAFRLFVFLATTMDLIESSDYFNKDGRGDLKRLF